MRHRWLAILPVAALLAVPACRAGDDASAPPPPVAAQLAAAPDRDLAPPAHLCDALPGHLVAGATGRSPVAVDGAGTQCSWRTPSMGSGTDVVLQGSFIDVRGFEAGRPDDVGATTVTGLGDDAYVMRVGEGAPTTLYVRDGHRAFALWLTLPADEAEPTLVRLARQVLAG